MESEASSLRVEVADLKQRLETQRKATEEALASALSSEEAVHLREAIREAERAQDASRKELEDGQSSTQAMKEAIEALKASEEDQQRLESLQTSAKFEASERAKLSKQNEALRGSLDSQKQALAIKEKELVAAVAKRDELSMMLGEAQQCLKLLQDAARGVLSKVVEDDAEKHLRELGPLVQDAVDVLASMVVNLLPEDEEKEASLQDLIARADAVPDCLIA